MTYETSMEFAKNAAMEGMTDSLQSASGSIIAGTVPSVGTGAFDVMHDFGVPQAYENQSREEKALASVDQHERGGFYEELDEEFADEGDVFGDCGIGALGGLLGGGSLGAASGAVSGAVSGAGAARGLGAGRVREGDSVKRASSQFKRAMEARRALVREREAESEAEEGSDADEGIMGGPASEGESGGEDGSDSD